ncbi:hypothetical protein ACFYVL_31680 [Streptomyces sp. NPDC004111]|uniref:hypothetical protein n=1 Tax=Streptomyces sp. NPDC004111 TaxID=3364690 RepID=UPI0036D13C7C
MPANDEALHTATARCKNTEDAVRAAQERYRATHAAAAQAEAARHRARRDALRAESVLLAALVEQESAVAALTSVLEHGARACRCRSAGGR